MQIREQSLQLAFNLDPNPIAYNLIDERFDVDFANSLAEKEAFNKHLYRPNSYLHKWWARRCGTTFRAILKHLVRDAAKSDYYVPGGLEGQIILDPMMGGGTTLHEAIRLGANVIGADIDPVPVLQARATLSEVSLPQIRREFATFLDALRTEMAHLYRSTCPVCGETVEQRFVLYGVHRRCQDHEAIVVDSYVLRHNADDSIVRISPETYDILIDDVVISKATHHPGLPLLEKRHQLDVCNKKFTDDLTKPYHQRYVPIAVVGECPLHGLYFAAPQLSDREAIASADRKRSKLGFERSDFDIGPGPKSSDLIKREITNYLDLFSSRQLLYLHTAIDLLQDVDPAVRLRLAMLVSTSTEFNSMLCGYKGAGKNRPGAIRHTFAHHAYSFPYTALENNPLHRSRSSGTLQNLFQSRIERGVKWAKCPIERMARDGKMSKVTINGEFDGGHECFDVNDLRTGTHRFMLIQGSSASLNLPDDFVDHVVTDPPYFDSVQYSDLAAFFRVWLKQLVPSGANWHYSLDRAAVDQQANGDGQYERVLGSIFKECHRVLKKERGRLIFTFHHWNPKGWAGLTIALKRGGFALINRYVIHAENPSSVHIINQNALVHDVVLVLGSATGAINATWDLPTSIDQSDSYAFCEQSGAALGYMLEHRMDDEEINTLWKQLLK